MKRAQMRMLESIFVMVVFMFLVGFGFVFYFGTQQVAHAEEELGLEEQRAVEVALFVAQLPELQCSDEGTEKRACIDIRKAEAMNRIVQDGSTHAQRDPMKLHYYDMFGFAEITLMTYYPSRQDIVVYRNEPDLVKFQKAGRSVYFPVTVKDVVVSSDTTTESYLFGELQVKVFT